MDELVQRLSEGDHPVVTRRADSAEELKQSIKRGYVLITFTDTQGGEEATCTEKNRKTQRSIK